MIILYYFCYFIDNFVIIFVISLIILYYFRYFIDYFVVMDYFDLQELAMKELKVEKRAQVDTMATNVEQDMDDPVTGKYNDYITKREIQWIRPISQTGNVLNVCVTWLTHTFSHYTIMFKC